MYIYYANMLYIMYVEWSTAYQSRETDAPKSQRISSGVIARKEDRQLLNPKSKRRGKKMGKDRKRTRKKEREARNNTNDKS